MKEETENSPKGIPVILLSRNCFYCSFYKKEDKTCKKKRPLELMYFAGIFCPDFKEYVVLPIEEISLENIEAINSIYKDNKKKIIRGEVFYLYPLDINYETPFPYLLKRIQNQEVIGRLLEELNSIKKSSPEARKIRKRLREKGFHLKPSKKGGTI